MRKLVGILGTPIDNMDTAEVLTRMEQFVVERGFHQVATANTDFLINALDDPELQTILQAADLVTPDGMPVVWASRLLGAPLPERVTGADIVPLLAERAAQYGWRVYLLGAQADVAQRACAHLEADYPGIKIVGCTSPPIVPLEEMDSASILADIERVRPDILLVAFGNPKQEKWIYQNRKRLQRVPLCMGVGGTFDFLARQTRRAPGWMQRRGLEWLFRLLREPGRLWRRYSRDFHRFGLALMKQVFAMRRCRRSGNFAMQSADLFGCTLLTLHGDIEAASLEEFHSAACAVLDSGSNLVLDMHDVVSMDGAALGALIALRNRADRAGRQIQIVTVSSLIGLALRHSQLFGSLYTADLSLAEALQECGAVPSQSLPPRLRVVGR
jgi:N-acetylglucosaminyldiphosphoundecaprenol N-acetyl-beta-D-mannosaminyltransferase